MNMNMKTLKPMLAAPTHDEDPSKITFPKMISPKLDGIRVLCTPEGLRTRSLKKVPNKFINSILQDPLLHYLDGEVVVGDPTAPDVFNKSTSGVMSEHGNPDFTYLVFDSYKYPTQPFKDRFRGAAEQIKHYIEKAPNNIRVKIVEHEIIKDLEDMSLTEAHHINLGYEGSMLRDPLGLYKYGRSTFKEQGLLKLKRFVDDEATVVGFEPLLRNNNPAEFDALGYQKRSSHKANKIPDALLGKLLCQHQKWGSFAIGSGFNVEQRIEIWENKDKYLNKLVTFKFQLHGSLNAPRIPIFKGFRED